MVAEEAEREEDKTVFLHSEANTNKIGDRNLSASASLLGTTRGNLDGFDTLQRARNTVYHHFPSLTEILFSIQTLGKEHKTWA